MTTHQVTRRVIPFAVDLLSRRLFHRRGGHSLISRLRTKATCWSLLVSNSLVISPARAFDYPEHAHISSVGIKLVLQTYDDNDSTVARDVLLSGAHALHASSLCPDDRVLSDAPDGCLALGDLPALSGDHAASPLLLKWR
jgi:hypothetical protein